jgi:hypothetical protein
MISHQITIKIININSIKIIKKIPTENILVILKLLLIANYLSNYPVLVAKEINQNKAIIKHYNFKITISNQKSKN